MTSYNKRQLLTGAASAVTAVLVFMLVSGRLPFVQPNQPDGVPAATIEHIRPHRAIYDMKLADTRSGSEINNATGQMMFVWTDACDGWTVEQRMELAFTYNDGGKQRIRSSLASWEAKDGSVMRYNVRRNVDNKLEAVYQGEAHVDSTGGTADYVLPAGKKETLAAGTLFPTLHTLQILTAAGKGERQLTRTVFDGADKEGQNQVTAFIGNPVEITAPEGASAPELRQGHGWPVQMAFFAPSNKNGLPDYEMKMTLLESGVANDLLIDYGDFTVGAKLRTIEPMPKPSC